MSTYKELFTKPKYGMPNLNDADKSTLSGKYQLYIMLYKFPLAFSGGIFLMQFFGWLPYGLAVTWTHNGPYGILAIAGFLLERIGVAKWRKFVTVFKKQWEIATKEIDVKSKDGAP